MSLTKKDLSQIRGAIVEGTQNLASKNDVESAVDNLARVVAKGFEQVNKQFETVDKRLSHLEMEASHTNARLTVIERDIAEIKKHFVYRDEFEDLMVRVAYLEKRAGIKSGK